MPPKKTKRKATDTVSTNDNPPSKRSVKSSKQVQTTGSACATVTADALVNSKSSTADHEPTPCAVCEQNIMDGKDQALYCEGVCKQWFHRYCAGIPSSWFEKFSTTTSPFLCYSCSHQNHADCITKLTESVSSLRSEIKLVLNRDKAASNNTSPLCAGNQNVSLSAFDDRPSLGSTQWVNHHGGFRYGSGRGGRGRGGRNMGGGGTIGGVFMRVCTWLGLLAERARVVAPVVMLICHDLHSSTDNSHCESHSSSVSAVASTHCHAISEPCASQPADNVLEHDSHSSTDNSSSESNSSSVFVPSPTTCHAGAEPSMSSD